MVHFDNDRMDDVNTYSTFQTHDNVLQLAKFCLQQACDRMKSQANKGRREAYFEVGNKVSEVTQISTRFGSRMQVL